MFGLLLRLDPTQIAGAKLHFLINKGTVTTKQFLLISLRNNKWKGKKKLLLWSGNTKENRIFLLSCNPSVSPSDDFQLIFNVNIGQHGAPCPGSWTPSLWVPNTRPVCPSPGEILESLWDTPVPNWNIYFSRGRWWENLWNGIRYLTDKKKYHMAMIWTDFSGISIDVSPDINRIMVIKPTPRRIEHTKIVCPSWI